MPGKNNDIVDERLEEAEELQDAEAAEAAADASKAAAEGEEAGQGADEAAGEAADEAAGEAAGGKPAGQEADDSSPEEPEADGEGAAAPEPDAESAAASETAAEEAPASEGDGEMPETVEEQDAEADDQPSDDAPTGYVVDEAAEAAEDMPFDPDGALVPGSDKDEFLGGSSDDWVDDNQTDYYRYGDKMHNVRDQVVNTDTSSGGLGRHGRPKAGSLQPPMNEHQRRSRQMRRVLIVVALLLVALLAALGYFGYQLLRESSSASRQQAAAPAATEVGEAATKEEAAKEVETAEKKTTVPSLMKLLDTTPQAALDSLGSGAIVTLDAAVDEEGNPVKRRQSIVLTEEPVDSKSGTPTVYLGMDSAGNVIQAGYSAATASLGYGTMSFSDAVTSGHIIEETLREAGLQVADGEAKLPSDSSAYSTYADDGKTLVKEQCTFEGKATQDGLDCEWSAVLLYNYTAANASGNLADTVRTVFVYIDLAQPEGAQDAAANGQSSSAAAQPADAAAAQPADAAAQPADAASAQPADAAAAQQPAATAQPADAAQQPAA